MRPPLACIYRLRCLVLLCGLLGVPQAAVAMVADTSGEPSEVDLQLIQRQIDQAKRALVRLQALPESIPAAQRQELLRRVMRAEQALKNYEVVAKRGKPRKRAQGILYAAGATLIMDDASLIGTADNVLLPIVAIGLLATQLLTHPAPKAPELGDAWSLVTSAMEAVGQEAERIKQEAARARRLPARKDCQKHYERCEDTPLGKPNSGGWGKSLCAACLNRCQGQGFWPDTLDPERPCQWWDWLAMAPTHPTIKRPQ